ncbi:MAG: hypothetical protein V1724_02935 [Chloroflexota bacterium]
MAGASTQRICDNTVAAQSFGGGPASPLSGVITGQDSKKGAAPGSPLLGEAFLVLMLVVVYMQTADMTTAWAGYMRWLLGSTALVDYNLAFTLTSVAAILAVMVIYLLITRWASAPGAC